MQGLVPFDLKIGRTCSITFLKVVTGVGESGNWGGAVYVYCITPRKRGGGVLMLQKIRVCTTPRKEKGGMLMLQRWKPERNSYCKDCRWLFSLRWFTYTLYCLLYSMYCMVRNFSSQFTEKIAAVKTKSFRRKMIIIVYKILLPSTHFPIKIYLKTRIFQNLAQLT